MADNFQKVIAGMFFIMLLLLGALFCAAIFIVPVISEALLDATDGQLELPMPAERLMSIGQLVLNSWTFFLVLYVVLIVGLLWWCISLRRR